MRVFLFFRVVWHRVVTWTLLYAKHSGAACQASDLCVQHVQEANQTDHPFLEGEPGMEAYHELMRHVLEEGVRKGDRTGTGTRSIFGAQLRFDLSQGFPAVTTKKLYFKGVVHELLWFLKGSTNVSYLQENKVKIWDEWADEQGELGPVYGKQWRSWERSADGSCVDQIAAVIESLKHNPNSRRHIVSAWNVADIEEMALPPCHTLFQFHVANKKLSCQLYQRSADLFLGVPFNIASYALLTHMIAQVTGYEVGDFVHTFGDAHIYDNHVEQVQLQLSREHYPLPTLWLDPSISHIDDFAYEHIRLEDYTCHPTIKAPIAV